MGYPQGIDRLMQFVFDRMPNTAPAEPPEEPFDVRRERGLNDLAAVIDEIYGARCQRNEGGCQCCTAWAVFDCIERLTDTER